MKSELKLMKYDPTRNEFVELSRDRWTIANGYLTAGPISAGIYGIICK